LEFEEIIEEYKPDLILAGVKEKYLAHKLGVPCVLIHSYENGPYMGFEGFVNLAKDMYSYIYNPVWDMLEFEYEPTECGVEEEKVENGLNFEELEENIESTDKKQAKNNGEVA